MTRVFECIITSLKLDSCNFCVCLLYRPPNASDVLDTLFSTLCSLDARVFANLIMVGDSNHNHPLFSKLFSVTSSFLLYQVIKSFTHYNQSATISALIWLLYHLCFYSIFVPLFLLSFLQIVRVLFFLSIQMLQLRDPPPALVELFGAIINKTLIGHVNYWSKLTGTPFVPRTPMWINFDWHGNPDSVVLWNNA